MWYIVQLQHSRLMFSFTRRRHGRKNIVSKHIFNTNDVIMTKTKYGNLFRTANRRRMKIPTSLTRYVTFLVWHKQTSNGINHMLTEQKQTEIKIRRILAGETNKKDKKAKWYWLANIWIGLELRQTRTTRILDLLEATLKK